MANKKKTILEYGNLDRPYNDYLERTDTSLDASSTLATASSADLASGSVAGAEGNGSLDDKSTNLGNTYLDGWIRSLNYIPKKSGFMINEPLGYAEFNNVYVSGILEAGEIHIPDRYTTNSFHVIRDGTTWWGATLAQGYANAPAWVLPNGEASFSKVWIGDILVDVTDKTGLQIWASNRDFMRGWIYATNSITTEFNIYSIRDIAVQLGGGTTDAAIYPVFPDSSYLGTVDKRWKDGYFTNLNILSGLIASNPGGTGIINADILVGEYIGPGLPFEASNIGDVTDRFNVLYTKSINVDSSITPGSGVIQLNGKHVVTDNGNSSNTTLNITISGSIGSGGDPSHTHSFSGSGSVSVPTRNLVVNGVTYKVLKG